MNTIGAGWEGTNVPPKRTTRKELKEILRLEASRFAADLDTHAHEIRRVIGSHGDTPALLEKAAQYLRELTK